MAVSRYFGLPGCGKTTVLTMLALKGIKSGKYKNVYTNVENLYIHGVTYVPFDHFGIYEFRDCLLLIDEAMVECGDRDFKAFGKDKIRAFVMHRHKYSDIVLFSQEPDGIDKKIRSITDRMYYVKKGLLTGKWISKIYKIPYGLVWPSENSNGENLGKIVMGYKKPPIIASLFCKRVYRPRYYPYFDSWEDSPLPAIPEKYRPYQDPNHRDPIIRPYLNKTIILLRSVRRYRKQLRRSKVLPFSATLPKRNQIRRELRRARRLTSECQALGKIKAPT